MEVCPAHGAGRTCGCEAKARSRAQRKKEAGLGAVSACAGHSTSCMKLKVAWIGKTKEPAIQSLTDEYLKRLSHYAEVEGSAVKDEAAVLKLCARDARPRHTLVLVDGRGKQLSSEELAKFMGDYQDRSRLP